MQRVQFNESTKLIKVIKICSAGTSQNPIKIKPIFAERICNKLLNQPSFPSLELRTKRKPVVFYLFVQVTVRTVKMAAKQKLYKHHQQILKNVIQHRRTAAMTDGRKEHPYLQLTTLKGYDSIGANSPAAVIHRAQVRF